MIECKIGMFLKRIDTILLDDVSAVTMPYRVIGIENEKINIQDVYGETQLYGRTAALMKFTAMEKGERTWLIHNVLPDVPTIGNYRNVHTHGAFWYGNFDFQVVIPYSIATVSQLLAMMVKRVQEREIFKDGDLVEGLFYEYPVKLMLVKESGRPVLRLLIPDKNGFFPDDARCDKTYQYQILQMFE